MLDGCHITGAVLYLIGYSLLWYTLEGRGRNGDGGRKTRGNTRKRPSGGKQQSPTQPESSPVADGARRGTLRDRLKKRKRWLYGLLASGALLEVTALIAF